jgi:hypothetical protein
MRKSPEILSQKQNSLPRETVLIDTYMLKPQSASPSPTSACTLLCLSE